MSREFFFSFFLLTRVVVEKEKLPQPKYSNSGFIADSAKRVLPLVAHPEDKVVLDAVVLGIAVVMLGTVVEDFVVVAAGAVVVTTPPPPGRDIAPAAKYAATRCFQYPPSVAS